MIKKSWILATVMLLLATFDVRAEDLKSGSWRFELRTEYAAIPFMTELDFSKKKVTGKIFNGREIIPLENIVHTRGKLRIPLQTYEITLELTQESPTSMKGLWIRHNKNPKIEIPVVAKFGETERFPGQKLPAKAALQGKWSVQLHDEQGVKTPGVAVFEQKGNYLSGSVLTPTGDYRYLEGYVSGEDFEAASFDGMFNYLVKGRVIENEMRAQMLATYALKIEGKRDESASLPDAYAATKLEEPLSFSFPNLDGKKVSLRDPEFKNRPVIVTFFGSWCPNCIDEMNYLIPWYKENKKRGIEIVALSFERSLSDEDAKRQLLKVKKKNNIPYPILLAGTTSADKPMDKIKGLKNFISFPTTVFLNKKHEVVKVHAGFTGPSTGEFFEKWKNEFNQTVDGLLK